MSIISQKTKRGHTFTYDSDDELLVSQFNWCSDSFGRIIGYTSRGKSNNKRTTVSLSRLLTSCPPDMVIDHIDRNPSNNCRSNLRVCTQSQNLRNRKVLKTNKSGIKGVFIMNICSRGKWYKYYAVDFRYKSKRYFKSTKSLKEAEKYRNTFIKSMGVGEYFFNKLDRLVV